MQRKYSGGLLIEAQEYRDSKLSMEEPTESQASGYSAMQAGIDRDYLFACWNEVGYGVGCVSGPFSGMLLAIPNRGEVPSREANMCNEMKNFLSF